MATKDTKVNQLIVNSMSREKFNSLTTDEKAQLSNQFVAVIGEDSLSNIVDGQGTSSAQMVQDGDSGTFDFTNKNPNATSADSTLTGQIAYGATGNFATALGGKSQASGNRSLAIGDSCVAQGENSVAIGQNSVALGKSSIAIGSATTSRNTNSITTGDRTVAAGDNAFSGGIYSRSIGFNAFSYGNNCFARNNNSVTFGINNATLATEQFLCGANSKPTTDTLFAVGNGTSDTARSNAFEVKKDGTIIAGGGLEIPHDEFIFWQAGSDNALKCGLFVEYNSSVSYCSLNYFDGNNDRKVILDSTFKPQLQSTISTPDKPATNTGNTHYIVEYDSYTQQFSVRQREVKHFITITGQATGQGNEEYNFEICFKATTTSNNPIDSVQDLTTQCGDSKYPISGYVRANQAQATDYKYFPATSIEIGTTITNSVINCIGFDTYFKALSEITNLTITDDVSM